MKKQIVLLSILSSLVAFSASAKEILVHEEASALTAPLVSAEFEVNKDLGRVWIAIGVSDQFREAGAGAMSDVRVKLPGLTYDAARGEIAYEGTVCAIAKQNALDKVFHAVRIKPTKACKLTSRSIYRDVDNGYEIEKTQYLQVYLSVRE
ncbi:MAG: hypothetical protein JST04_07480 [Bdellovibrionales bacterium]|nr:hypothetical protein [Bdellovibrionales bacterium]